MCNDALKHKSEVNLRNSLRLMANVGDSPEGGQALAKLDFPKVYRQVVDVFRDSSDIQNILAAVGPQLPVERSWRSPPRRRPRQQSVM
ncbi:MAG: uncharacterized protein KVP18_002006 [Porospora cf. gigantea A]|uniref:uncharacterized protein n=1 Tax=Porospora cf. gigantea A TaxID=2853593 RepID=UPI003559FE0A|nr:MAG: hypothetical protein KVP18_002006 [Porospora cf. gigantea A]